jgi:osmotically-inducible protein OsmY
MTRHTRPRRVLAIVSALAALTALGACAPLIVGGAMVGGSMMAVDRRTSGAQVEDQTIELKGVNRVREVIGSAGHVNITSYNRQVLLTGEVPAEADKAAIEQAIGRTENLRSIVNDLAVMPPSSLGSRSGDTLITSKVKASLVDAKDLISSAFKVVTERNVVYLMGRVTEREATRAAEVASGVAGVEKVVRVFDIVSEAELAGQIPAK